MQQCAQFAREHLSEPLSEMRTGISDGIYPGFQKTPRCRNCNNVVRPGVTLYGEQLDSHLTSLAATEVEKAEVLLLLGTKLSSDVYSNYVKFLKVSRSL